MRERQQAAALTRRDAELVEPRAPIGGEVGARHAERRLERRRVEAVEARLGVDRRARWSARGSAVVVARRGDGRGRGVAADGDAAREREVREAVEGETLSIHGLWNDIGDGSLLYFDPENADWRPVE